ncbi:MAG TPA: tetratricopeptide repeat protein [Gammaproteobacteria bacterium]|nr:tetratricopeptide repeat protein [Gammaproteobacteria bacterium]
MRISRTDTVAEIVVDLACPMRFLADARTDAGALVEVRVAPFESCRQLGPGIASEAYRPVGGQLAHLTEIEYESAGLGDSLLLFRFDQPMRYRVSQRADLRQVLLEIDLAAPAVTADSTVRASPAISATPLVEARTDRSPLTVQARTPQTAADYVINLQSTRDPVERAAVTQAAPPPGKRVYVSQTTLTGETWYRLRVGFFESESAARTALEPMAAHFPRAWIGRAAPAEISFASRADFETGSLIAETASAGGELTVAATPRGAGEPSATPERTAELMETARNALIDRQYDSAARLYTQLLAEPGDHQRDAREYLGVAREKLGQFDGAIAEYRAYLQEYPDGPGTSRVQRRLEGLLTAASAPRETLRRSVAATEPAWDFVTGFSQYYRRDVDRLEEATEDFVGLSAMQSDIDVSARGTGGRFDMLSRISASHFYDMIGEENDGPGDQTRVTYAYFDMVDTQRDWSLRVGRQSLHQWGVLGRFDGAHVSYGWQPDRRVHLTMGYPVDSTRDGVETGRRFIGAAASFDELLAGADVSVFVSDQQIEGIEARRAVGADIRYAGENGSITGIVDYDVGYSELNSILALGAWRVPWGATVSGLIDVRLSPILTTRNALIGQPVTTIDELLLVWTEDEIRQLAVDRTAQSRTLTFGISQPLGERLQLNADITTTEIDGTLASGGVAAIPGTGAQTYLATSLVGTGFFGHGDVNMLNLRFGEGQDFTAAYLTWDSRFAVGRRLRINPRLRYAVRDGTLDGSTRETLGLALRLLYNTAKHYRFELEIGADTSRRADSISEVETSGYYLSLGYRAIY